MEKMPQDVRHPPAAWMILAAFAALYISWGTTFLAIKWGVQNEQLPPALFGGVRLFLAGVILLGILQARGHSIRLCRRDLQIVALIGVILFVGGNGLLNLGQTTIDSSAAAVLTATSPLWIALFGALISSGDRFNRRGWLGVPLGLFGVVLLFAPKLEHPQTIFNNLGPFFVLGSACAWAVGGLLARHRRPSCGHLIAAGWQMAIGGGTLSLIGICCGEMGRLPSQVTPGALLAFLYLLVVGSFVGFLAYNWLLGQVSAAKVGTHAYVNPMVAVLIGWGIGEPFSWWLGGAIGVILAGVALVRTGEYKVEHQASNPLEQEETEPQPLVLAAEKS